MITPHQLDFYASNMAELYNSLEWEILKLMIKHIKKHGYITEWQARAAGDLMLLNEEVSEYLEKVTGVARIEIEQMFKDTGHELVKSVDGQVPFDPKPIPNNLNTIMNGYSNQTWLDVNNFVNQTLVSTNYGFQSTVSREYTNVLNRSSALFNTGIYTQDEAVEKAIQELAQKGIRSTFIDKGGHTWSMERYVRTVMKSTLHNTYNKVTTDRMADYNLHTVRVSQHVGAREACSKIQGNVVDLRDTSQLPFNSKVKSIHDPYWQANYGEPEGHMGVNCRHYHIPFVVGVNENNAKKIDPELNEQVAKATDKQRRLEREIVRFKKNRLVSEAMGNEQAVKSWQASITAKQRQMREHLSQNNEYLSRDYKREKVYTPLDTLLKDFNYKGSI